MRFYEISGTDCVTKAITTSRNTAQVSANLIDPNDYRKRSNFCRKAKFRAKYKFREVFNTAYFARATTSTKRGALN